MKTILFSLVTMISFSALANESKYESYDCKFTNEEVQTAFEKRITDYFASIAVTVKAGTFKVSNSPVNPASQYFPSTGMIAKKIEFEASTGEKLALQSFGRNGDLEFLNMGPTLDGLILDQSKLTTYDKLGNEVQTTCVLSVRSNGLFMVFKNLVSDLKLIELTKGFNKFAGDDLNALGSKNVP